MVSLDVATAKFGPKPDPDFPEPHYPSIPFKSCDALGALVIYRGNLKKDRDIRANMLQLQHERPGPIHHARRLNDMMPGLSSLAEVYDHMGFQVDPVTKRRVPPDIKAPTPKPEDLMSTPSVSSRASSALVRGGSETASSRSMKRSESVPHTGSHFAPPRGGICCLSKEQREQILREKELIQRNVGQNRFLAFV
mmetsp:Transcript_77177/g.136207  ORF Transcript_77177/g.136207 Transcript_77177/m.136207 type:complete len:194 (-) Transcript_77177:66-647(-)|eukprot:CAMPEP_0197631234 /NCGR_PEP_ID=MMETSP1338-20131121/8471_1 /TAXON_ID=43686 ORGANISM="Pelagodinium beii, Strain RCC1491" /NCGR_SAMPLE_ID=MMETSP1338 /ASSEMBLY_ACC=CAM_ASM_000754 /LENGTH=193 /DNA_ID=CAMNT_0043202649 /DNA_START=39 /DNA_END=620 /DNA_ORIENTATION=+